MFNGTLLDFGLRSYAAATPGGAEAKGAPPGEALSAGRSWVFSCYFPFSLKIRIFRTVSPFWPSFETIGS